MGWPARLAAAESILADLAFERNFIVHVPECYHERIAKLFQEKSNALRPE